MKVLFVSDLYPSKEKPQYCVFLEQQAQAMQKQGHTVDVLRIQRDDTQRGIASSPYVQNGLNVYTWYYQHKKWNELLLLPFRECTLRPFLEENHYDVVSLHFGSCRLFETVAKACRGLKTAVLMHYHGLNVWSDYYSHVKQRLLQPWHNHRKKQFLNRVDAIVGVSDLTCDKVRLHHKKNNVFTVYNGVDSTIFGETQEENVATPFQILCVGNLIPIKGQTYLLQAVAEVLKSHSVELLLVGDGPDRQKLENQAAQLGISHQVRFLGTQPYDRVATYMAMADMFIMPSYFEAFGCVYVEAMSSGTLTCGCENNGAQEIIQDGVDGLLLREKSAEDIAAKIVWAIENPAEAARLAENGKKKAAQFSWEKSAEMLLAVYEKCKK